MEKTIGVIILSYDFLENTTSANRFETWKYALQKKESISLNIIDFHFEDDKSNTISRSIGNPNRITESNVNVIYPKVCAIQKFVLKARSNYLKFLYQLFFREEVVTPRTIDFLDKLSNVESNEGYLIASGAPYGIFKCASRAADKLGYRLLLDYRDPWTYGYQNLNGFKLTYTLKKFLLRKTERALLEKADLITTVSPTLKSYFPVEFQHKIHVIPNGSNYTESEIREKQDKTFNIVYTGTIYNDQLQDDTFFLALKQFLHNKDRRNIKLQFLGSFYTTSLKEKIEQYGLSDIVTITKRLKKDELLPYLNNANVFLHLKYGNRSGIITSKQADYLFFRKPILLPVSDNGDLAESISEHKAGYICHNQVEILEVLEELYHRFQQGETLKIQQSAEMLKQNSREAIAERFVDLILEKK